MKLSISALWNRSGHYTKHITPSPRLYKANMLERLLSCISLYVNQKRPRIGVIGAQMRTKYLKIFVRWQLIRFPLSSSIKSVCAAVVELCFHTREQKTAPNWRHWSANADMLLYVRTKFLPNSVRWELKRSLSSSSIKPVCAAVCRQSLIL